MSKIISTRDARYTFWMLCDRI